MSQSNIFAKEVNISDFDNDGKYILDSTSVDSTYTPRETDIITVVPVGDGNNIKCWVEFVTNEWHVHVSGFDKTQKIQYRIRARSY